MPPRATSAVRVGVILTAESRDIQKALQSSDRAINNYVKRTERQFKGLTDATRRLGNQLRFLFGGFVVFRSISTFIQITSQFSKAMAELNAILKTNESQSYLLEQSIRALGRTTIFTSQEIASANTVLARAGFSFAEILNTQASALRLAQATSTPLVKSMRVLASTIRTFNRDASEAANITDVLVTAVNSANTTMEEFIQALSYAAPTAAPLNKSLEETASILAVLADRGINASRGGVIIRQTFFALSRRLRQFGIDVQNTGLIDILKQLRDETRFTFDDIVDTLETRAGFAINLMLPLIDEIEQMEMSLHNVDGEAKRLAETMDDSIFGALRRVKSAASDFTQVLVRDTLGTRNTIDNLNLLTRAINGSARQMDILASVVLGGIGAWVAYKIITSGIGNVFRQLIALIAGKFIPVFAGATEKTVGFARATAAARAATTSLAGIVGTTLKSNILGIAGLLAGLGISLATYFALAKDEVDELRDRLNNIFEGSSNLSAKFTGEISKLIREAGSDNQQLLEGLNSILLQTGGSRDVIVEEIERQFEDTLKAFTDAFFFDPNLIGAQAIERTRGKFGIEADFEREIDRIISALGDSRLTELIPENIERAINRLDTDALEDYIILLQSISGGPDSEAAKAAGALQGLKDNIENLVDTEVAELALQKFREAEKAAAQGLDDLARSLTQEGLFRLEAIQPGGVAEEPRSLVEGKLNLDEVRQAITDLTGFYTALLEQGTPLAQALKDNPATRQAIENQLERTILGLGDGGRQLAENVRKAVQLSIQDKLTKDQENVLEEFERFDKAIREYLEIIVNSADFSPEVVRFANERIAALTKDNPDIVSTIFNNLVREGAKSIEEAIKDAQEAAFDIATQRVSGFNPFSGLDAQQMLSLFGFDNLLDAINEGFAPESLFSGFTIDELRAQLDLTKEQLNILNDLGLITIEVAQEWQSFADTISEVDVVFRDFITDAITDFDRLGDAASQVFLQIKQALVRNFIADPIINALSGFFAGIFPAGVDIPTSSGKFNDLKAILPGITRGPDRAVGGSVAPNVPITVGERGRETFIPSTAGYIMPNGAEGGRIVINNHFVVEGGNDEASVERKLYELMPQIETYMERGLLRAMNTPTPFRRK